MPALTTITGNDAHRWRIVHDDVIEWKHFPRYWSFVRGIHRSPVNSPAKARDAEMWCFLWSAPEWRLSKQLWGWRFETPSRPLWRHSNGLLWFVEGRFGVHPDFLLQTHLTGNEAIMVLPQGLWTNHDEHTPPTKSLWTLAAARNPWQASY